MGPDFDLLDDFLLGTPAKTARAVGKFQPKLRPRKGPSVLKSSVQSDKAEKVVTDVANELSASSVLALEEHISLDCVNKSLDHFVNGETLDVKDSLNNSEILTVCEDSPSNNSKSAGVNVDAYFGLESLEDLCSHPTTEADIDVGASGKSGVEVSFYDSVESASHMQEPCSAVSPDEFNLDEFSYSFPEINAEFEPYATLDSTTELPGNNESLNDESAPPVEISQEDISFSAMDTPASKVATEGDWRIGSEEEADKCKKKAPTISKRSVSEKGKSVSKRTRDDENPDQPIKKIPKRFPRSTRRSKRQVSKALLETPEDELDLQQISIRDIILLAEHREKLEKDKKSKESHPANPSNSIPQHTRDENASEKGGLIDEETDPPVQDGCVYTNYHSYMEKTPRVRWSKQDTELFYQGVRQFGSDLSFIQQLFPGRTRNQIKLKYKKEERQNSMTLHDALTGRAIDNSHFEQLIQQLKKAQDDSANIASNENLCDPTISGGEMEKSEQVVKKTEQEEEFEKMEQAKEFEKVEPGKEEVEKAMEEDVSKHYSKIQEDEDDDEWDFDYNSVL